MNSSSNTSNDHGDDPSFGANETLHIENRNRHVPNAILGFSSPDVGERITASAGISSLETALTNEAWAISNESLTLRDTTYSYINSVDGRSKIVANHSIEQWPKDGEFVLDLLYGNDRASYELDHQLGLSLIDPFINWRRKMQGISESTLTANVSRLRRLLNAQLIYDHGLQMWRPFTVREYLTPDYGRAISLCVMEILTEDLGLGQVAIDLLSTLRVYLRSICQGGTILEDGTNVRHLWGVLTCPLNDRDIQKRKVKSAVFLPRIDEMMRIHEAALDWARGRKRKRVGYRTATAFSLACETGLRGVEVCDLDLANQFFDRSKGPHTVGNPFQLYNAKVGGAREAEAEPYGLQMVRAFIRTQRPKLIDDQEGWIFPSERGNRLSSGSFSETTRGLIDYLKGRGLLHKEFSFHSTRKLYATHFMERDGNIDKLLRQCGWSNSGQLAVYLRPSFKAIKEQEARFAGALNRSALGGH